MSMMDNLTVTSAEEIALKNRKAFNVERCPEKGCGVRRPSLRKMVDHYNAAHTIIWDRSMRKTTNTAALNKLLTED